MKDFFSSIDEIEKKIDYHFHNPDLLLLAFTHRSYWNEHKQAKMGHNERLEFLGDSVLELMIAEHLYLALPEVDEGILSALRAQLVDATACSGYVQKLDIEGYLLLGCGEQMNHGKGRESILADLFESLIGAIYLDSGFSTAKKFLISHFKGDIEKRIEKPMHNWKAELQDYAQKICHEAPVYELIEQFGLEHEKQFRIVVLIQGKKVGEGVGSSKKEAQMMAAKYALENLS